MLERPNQATGSTTSIYREWCLNDGGVGGGAGEADADGDSEWVVVLIVVETGAMVVVGKIVPDTRAFWAPGSVLRVLQNDAGLQVLRFLFCR